MSDDVARAGSIQFLEAKMNELIDARVAAANRQIDALKVDLAAMQKERDAVKRDRDVLLEGRERYMVAEAQNVHLSAAYRGADKSFQIMSDGYKTLLGRAVAALQEARGWCVHSACAKLTTEPCAAPTGNHGFALPSTLCNAVRTIIADPSATAVVEAWRAQREEQEELEAVYRAAKGMETVCGYPCGNPQKCGNCIAVLAALAKVDARRGGK